MGIGVEVENALDYLLLSFVSSKSTAMCTALIPIAITGSTIYLLVMGFATMRGDANDPLHTFVWKFFRISLIAGIALSAGEYQRTIVDGTDALVAAFLESMSGFTSVGAVVDDIAKPFSELGQQLWNHAVTGFWPNFALIAAAGAVAIAQFLMFAIGLGFFLLAKVALSLILAVGPAFILCAMWPGTQKYTESWLGQMLNYIVLKVLVAVCILMLTDFASKFAAHIQVTTDAVNVIKATTALVCCSGALVVVMLNLPQLASALSGGASIAGIGRTIGKAALDMMNRPTKSKPPPAGGEISAGRGPGQGTGTPPPPRKPLFQRNTIERLRKAS